MVIVKKSDNTLRICLDPQYLNTCLLRQHFKLPTFEEISSKMTNAKIFSILDCNQAFYQIKLNEKSRLLTTFNTPVGRYCFKRMPYGIKTAPEIFQKKAREIFGNIPNVEVYIDDIIIWSKDLKQHEIILKEVMKVARENNIKFNLKKCIIAKNKVKFLGHEFTEQGIKMDDTKIEAIKKIEIPTSKKELETFLAMISYVSKFIPSLTNLTAILRELVKKNSEFIWKDIHTDAFMELKAKLIKSPILQYYNPSEECTLTLSYPGGINLRRLPVGVPGTPF